MTSEQSLITLSPKNFCVMLDGFLLAERPDTDTLRQFLKVSLDNGIESGTQKIIDKLPEELVISSLQDLITKKRPTDTVRQSTLKYLIEKDLVQAVCMFISVLNLDPSTQDNYTLMFAIKSGSTQVVKMLIQDKRVGLSQYKGVNPVHDKNHAIIMASIYGHTDIFKLLLEDPRIDIRECVLASYDNPFEIASRRGHTEIVQCLLAHPHIVPNFDNNTALKIAAENNRTDVLKLLLVDPRVTSDPSLFDVETKNITDQEIVKLIMAHKINICAEKCKSQCDTSAKKEYGKNLLDHHRNDMNIDYEIVIDEQTNTKKFHLIIDMDPHVTNNYGF